MTPKQAATIERLRATFTRYENMPGREIRMNEVGESGHVVSLLMTANWERFATTEGEAILAVLIGPRGGIRAMSMNKEPLNRYR